MFSTWETISIYVTRLRSTSLPTRTNQSTPTKVDLMSCDSVIKVNREVYGWVDKYFIGDVRSFTSSFSTVVGPGRWFFGNPTTFATKSPTLCSTTSDCCLRSLTPSTELVTLHTTVENLYRTFLDWGGVV